MSLFAHRIPQHFATSRSMLVPAEVTAEGVDW